MGTIIQLNKYSTMINAEELKENTRRLQSGLILPAKETRSREIAADHTSEPIKKMADIMKISDYLIANGRYRDNMLFIVGINFGLRVSDLRLLCFSDLINPNLTFKDSFPILEQKTKKTRKVRRNRYITINTAVIEAVTLYLENTSGVSLSDYLFMSESNRSVNKHGEKVPLHRASIDQILKGIADDLGLNVKMSTHTLRKTFAYHQMVMSNNDPRKLLLLSKMMGHSSISITLDYIGITSDEIDNAYRNLNLGSKECNYLNSEIQESTSLIG